MRINSITPSFRGTIEFKDSKYLENIYRTVDVDHIESICDMSQYRNKPGTLISMVSGRDYEVDVPYDDFFAEYQNVKYKDTDVFISNKKFQSRYMD